MPTKNKDVVVPRSIIALSEEQRSVKLHELKNQQKALESLDDHVMEALDGLYKLMQDEDKYVRLRAIEIVLKKVIPEKKIKQIVGADGGPVKVEQKLDIRSMIMTAAAELDTIDLEELTEASRNGSIKVFGTGSGSEGTEEN